MLADKDGDGESPPRPSGDGVRAVQVHDGAGRDASGPRKKVKRGNPGADAVRSDGGGTLMSLRQLEEIGSKLDNVVEEKADRD